MLHITVSVICNFKSCLVAVIVMIIILIYDSTLHDFVLNHKRKKNRDLNINCTCQGHLGKVLACKSYRRAITN